MKLLNYTLLYLSLILFAVIGIWAAIFYVNMLDEIHDSIDDGLENSKLLIIGKVHTDSSLIHKNDFMESNYAIHEIPRDKAIHHRDIYIDSTLYMINENDYEPVRILKSAFAGPGDKFYELWVVSSMVEEDDLIEDLLYSIIWLYVILLASVILINNVLLRRIWRPFYDILNKLKVFELGRNENIVMMQSNVLEFKTLRETVEGLLKRTIDSFHSQKQFIENASHELQTPLAISVNKLELYAEKNSLSDSQLKEIGGVIESLERLTRINKTLLLLSRIDNKQFSESESVDFGALFSRLIASFSDLADFRQVEIVTEQRNQCIHLMNRELAETMASNLLKNAIVHNHPNGKILLVLDANQFSIENTSTSPAADPDHIFDRFYKNTSSRNSTGLGLAIVKSIADLYSISVKYSFSAMHKFTVRFQRPESV